MATHDAENYEYADFSDEDGIAGIAANSRPAISQNHNLSQRNCYECRRKKRKCDRKLPDCGLCIRTNTSCDYTRVPEKSSFASPGHRRIRAPTMNSPASPSMEDEDESVVGSPAVAGAGSLSEIDPADLYPSQQFENLRDFKQHVFDIARVQGWTPYLRRSDRRGAEVRCHSMPNPYKPRTVEFNQAGCQFRVAARTWASERRGKTEQLQDVAWNTPGRWGDGSEPARVTMVQPFHICGRVNETGWTNEEAEEESTKPRSSRARKRKSQDFASPASVGSSKARAGKKAQKADSMTPTASTGGPEGIVDEQASLWAPNQGGEMISQQDTSVTSGRKSRKRKASMANMDDDDDYVEVQTQKRKRRIADSIMPGQSPSNSAVANNTKRTRKNEGLNYAQLAAVTPSRVQPSTPQQLEPSVQSVTIADRRDSLASNPSSSKSTFVRKPRGPNKQSNRNRKPREANVPIPAGMTRKTIHELIREVPSLFDSNPNWLEEVNGPAIVEAARSNWNCYVGKRQAYQVLFKLREEKGMVTSLRNKSTSGIHDGDIEDENAFDSADEEEFYKDDYDDEDKYEKEDYDMLDPSLFSQDQDQYQYQNNSNSNNLDDDVDSYATNPEDISLRLRYISSTLQPCNIPSLNPSPTNHQPLDLLQAVQEAESGRGTIDETFFNQFFMDVAKMVDRDEVGRWIGVANGEIIV